MERIEDILAKANLIVISETEEKLPRSALVNSDQIDQYEKTPEAIVKKYYLTRSTDLFDLRSFFRLEKLSSTEEPITDIKIQFHNRHGELIETAYCSDKGLVKFATASSYYQISEYEKFHKWLDGIRIHYKGFEDGKITGSVILDIEKRQENTSYKSEERKGVIAMGRYVEDYYNEMRFGKSNYDGDETSDAFVRSIIFKKTKFPKLEKKRKKQNEKLKKNDPEYYDMLENGIKKDDFSESKNIPDSLKPLLDMISGGEEKVNKTYQRKGPPFSISYEDLSIEEKHGYKVRLAWKKRELIQEEVYKEENKKKYPLPLYFCTQYDWFYYSESRQYKVGFEDKKPFRLFLAFKLRNTKPSEMHYWLDELYRMYGEQFLNFLPTVASDYHFLFRKRKQKLKAIEDWISSPLELIDTDLFQFLPLPPDYQKIQFKSKWNDEQIIKFFCFLYKEKNKNGSPILEKEDFRDLLKYGFCIPPDPLEKKFTLNLQRSSFSVKAIGYCLGKLFQNFIKIQDEKEKLAKFLKFYFTNFAGKSLEEIKKDILRSDKFPKTMNITIENYFPNSAENKTKSNK